jgi:hypothetical protein
MRPGSYITALPFMASVSSERVPAAVVLAFPVTPYQCIALLGPAWKTRPLVQVNSHR